MYINPVHDAMVLASNSALLNFGHKAQMIKTCEELAELTIVLCKRLNESPVTNEQIIDEVADVFFMVNQMRLLFGADEVDNRVLYKVGRTMQYIQSRGVGNVI